jgi:hypothetical protein
VPNSSIMLRSYSSIVSILSPWMPAMRSRRRVRVSGASMSMALSGCPEPWLAHARVSPIGARTRDQAVWQELAAPLRALGNRWAKYQLAMAAPPSEPEAQPEVGEIDFAEPGTAEAWPFRNRALHGNASPLRLQRMPRLPSSPTAREYAQRSGFFGALGSRGPARLP